MIYIISTNIFIIMKINVITKTAPIITGKREDLKHLQFLFQFHSNQK